MKTRFLKISLSQKGQTSTDYLLAVAVLALGLAAALWNPTLKNAIGSAYDNAGSRIVKPGK